MRFNILAVRSEAIQSLEITLEEMRARDRRINDRLTAAMNSVPRSTRRRQALGGTRLVNISGV